MHSRVSDLYEWKCKSNVVSADNVSMANSGGVALMALLPHLSTIVGRQQTQDPTYDVPRSNELSRRVADEFKALLASLESTLGSQFDEVRSRTSI